MPAKLANATDALAIRVRYARGPDVGSDNALSSSCVTDFHPNRPLAFLGDGCQNWLDIEYLTCVVFIPCGKTAPISRQVCRSKVPRNSQAFDKKAFEMPFAMESILYSSKTKEQRQGPTQQTIDGEGTVLLTGIAEGIDQEEGKP